MKLKTIKSLNDYNMKKQANTCSRSPIETLEQGEKYLQS